MNIEINKLKLQKKLGTTQTGGKGTSRRTIKQVYKRNSKKKNTKIVSGLKNTIKEINKKILQLNEKNYVIFRDFIDGLVIDYMKDLKRDDINKSSGLRYAEINNEGVSFIYRNFFYPVDETKILIKSNVYDFIDKSFRTDGKNIFIKFIESIDKIMVKKEYEIDLDNEKYYEDEFNRALEHFNIDINEKVHFKLIREKYREYMDANIDVNMDNTNMYYTLLRNQYDDYLKST